MELAQDHVNEKDRRGQKSIMHQGNKNENGILVKVFRKPGYI
jgi:hypothetical protein